ncbi:MAG: DUF4912 domain-containing protein, partial [Microcystaceae cyanobacterium]
LLWWLKGRGPDPVVGGTIPPARASSLVLTPRNCKEADAHWEIPDEHKATLRRQGGEELALRLYDVTDIDIDSQTPHSVREFECDERLQERHLPIPRDNRDYLVELGYKTPEGRWLSLARSAHVRVPACPPVVENVGKTGAAAIATGAAAVTSAVAANRLKTDWDSRIAMIPRDAKHAYVHWDVSEEHKEVSRQQGGQQLTLRVHDADNIDLDTQPAHSTQEYPCDENEWEKVVPIPVSDRDYVAEIGYLTEDSRWLRLARSLHTHIPSSKLTDEVVRAGGAAIAGAGAAAASLGTAARSLISDERTPIETASKITLVPRNAQEAYVSWEIEEAEKEALKQQGGEKLTLRVYEVTNMDMDDEPAHSVQQFDCDEREQHRFVPIPLSDRDYVAELGYLTSDNRWLSLARSLHTRVPSV